MSYFIQRQFAPSATETAGQPSQNTEPAQLVHHVFFWLKNAGNESDRKQLTTGIQTLGGITEIKKMFIGTPAPTEERGVVDASYDVSELLFFDNTKDQAIYQSHAIHQAFIEEYSHLWRKVVVYDMLVVV